MSAKATDPSEKIDARGDDWPGEVALVMLPGLDGTGDLFAPLTSMVPPGYDIQTVRYPANPQWAFEDYVAHVRQQLPVDKPFVLLAESFSGPVGIQLASEQPRSMTGLVLCCTFSKNPCPRLAMFKSLLPMVPFALLPFGPLAALLLNGAKNSATRLLVKETIAKLKDSVIRKRLKIVMEVDVTSALAAITVPVLYLQGLRDLLVPSTCGRDIQSAVRHRIEVISIDGPHALLQSAPKLCAQALQDFVDSLRAPSLAKPST